jgi:CubicO group peptidase (beta-lactamase class C family)
MQAINDAVQPVLDDLVSRDVERGLQVAAYLDGELVLDAWAGLADATTDRRVDGDTLFVAFSCGKGVVAAATHLLADRGQIGFADPAPRFAFALTKTRLVNTLAPGTDAAWLVAHATRAALGLAH